MNPPSALFGAMNRERKPFTYTPGGLDLSEIKSERMAQRLMRNAMNQGVPETPAHSVRSPPASGIPVAIPNFNCLPVQVFPTFQLPANPKSLLRTRSNPDGSRETNRGSMNPQFIDNVNRNVNKQNYNNSSNNSQNHDRFESNSYDEAKNFNNMPKSNYGYKKTMEPMTYINEHQINNNTNVNDLQTDKSITEQRDVKEINGFDISKTTTKDTINNDNFELNSFTIQNDIKEEATENENKQEEISIKQTKKIENGVDNQNGDTETAVVVKLPTKKSAAKTETKVEVVKKTLPDGSVQEVKTTTTRTTIDGKTEISTKTETKTLSKEETDEEVEEEEIEENEEEENSTHIDSRKSTVETITKTTEVSSSKNTTKENGELAEKSNIKENGGIIKQVENIETSTTKKVVVIQSKTPDSEEEAEEIDEEIEEEEEEEEEVDQDVDEVVVVEKQNVTQNETIHDVKSEPKRDSEDLEDDSRVENGNDDEDEQLEEEKDSEEEKNGEDEKNEEDEKEMNETITQENEGKTQENNEDTKIENDQNSEINEDETEIKNDVEKLDETVENEKEETTNNALDEDKKPVLNDSSSVLEQNNNNIDKKLEEKIIPIQTESSPTEEKCQQNEKLQPRNEIKESFVEPTIPLEKVEEVEIKPIGAPVQEVITKSHKEIISTTTDKPSGALSTQTEYNIIENIVTVNRTTKTLDHAYEQAGEYTIPVVKTSLIPESSGILPPPPVFNRTYQTSYSKEPGTERRHSLLLERLSVERQTPTSSVYQTDNIYSNNVYDGRSTEPQSEILIESNVKPSMVNKNQQWYARKDSYDSVTPTLQGQPWIQSQPPSQSQTQYQPEAQQQYQPQIQQQYQPQTQQQYQSQPQQQYQPQTQQQYQPQTQQQYQPPPQQQYQSQPQPQYLYAPQTQCLNQTTNYQTQYSPQPHPQPAFTETIAKDTYKSSINSYNQNSYPSYTPKPSWVSSTVDPKPTSLSQSNQYSFEADAYQKSTHNQSSYVPPPWEQGAGYNVNNVNQSLSQSQTIPTTPIANPTPSWKAPNNKFTKKPTSYVPPAPNQSFVKPVSGNADPPKLPGRKTYYSEYERRYITVPETTYIPTETKFQAQPDPSPKYYYDQNEPVETTEPQWRKELREFTEKTQTSSQTMETSVRPPWEEEPKYVTSSDLSNTQTWSQTLRPRSYRERSIESEYTSTAKDWSKSNTLGRGRPQSSYINNLQRIPERPRGVSVDRYNPNIYQSPLSGEHPPVQSQTLDPLIHPKPHYNPNIPAYHSRATAEPREQPVYNQPRTYVDTRTPPVQSRSFKYLQWITGTED